MYSEQGCSYSLLKAVIKSLFDLSHQNVDTHCVDTANYLSKLKQDDHMDRDDAERTLLNAGSLDSGVREHPVNEKLLAEESRREDRDLRQKLMQELESLHARECSQQMEAEQERTQLRKERAALLAEKEHLKDRESLLAKEYENKLEWKIRELKADFTTKMHTKEKSVEDLQNKLSEKEQKLEQVEIDFSRKHSSFDILKKELEDMQKMHKNIYEKYSTLLNDNTNLLRKFESMSDYAVIKDELQTKSLQVSNLHKEIETITATLEKERRVLTDIVKNMEAKLVAKDKELQEVHHQLNVIRDTLHMKEGIWYREKGNLEQENLASKDMYRMFNQKLEEQKEDIRALHQTIHLLHYQLSEKDTRGPSTSEPSTQPFTIQRVKNEPNIFRINKTFRDSPPKYKERSLKFIEDAKSEISQLRRQQDEWQDKCSIVYSSVPELNSHFLSNPLVFNATNAAKNPMSSYSSNLNNFIGNEMPNVLDLSFPANIKNSLANSFTESQVMKQPDVQSGIDSTLINDENLVISSSRVRDKIDSTTQEVESILPLSLKTTDSKTLEYFNKNNTVYSGLTNESQTHENTLKKKNAPDVDLLQKEITADRDDITDKKMSKNIFQEEKLLESDKSLKVSSLQQEKIVSELASGVLSGLASDALKSLNHENSKQNLHDSTLKTPDDPIKTVTDNLDSKFADNTRSTKAVADTPFVVDLDAAWKRKSSLLPIQSPSKHSSLEKQQFNKEHTFNRIPTPPEEISQSQNNFKELSQLESKTDPPDVEVHRVNANQERCETESAIQVEMGVGFSTAILDEVVPKPATVGQGSTTSDLNKQDSNGSVSSEPEEDVISDGKNDDNSLSDIHFSCGSEQEQQKEDSDNW